MSKIFLVIIGTILISLSCCNDPGSSPICDSGIIAGTAMPIETFAGLQAAFLYTDIQPLAGVSSGTDSVIEHTFSYLWQ